MQIHAVAKSQRGGFTLVELLVAISIVVVLAAVTVPLAMRFGEGRKARDAARTVQAAIAGARDRAMGAGFPVGVRFLQESTDKSIVRSMTYIRLPLPANLGKARSLRTGGVVTDLSKIELISGPNVAQLKMLRQVTRSGVKYFVGAIRFEQATRYYTFSASEADLDAVPPILTLDEPLVAPLPEAYGAAAPPPVLPSTDFAGADYKIPLGSLPLEDANPIRLPDGVVIDLGTIDGDANNVVDSPNVRLSRVPVDSQSGYFDILFAPNGQVINNAAVEQYLALWIREETAGVEETLVSAGMRQKRIPVPVRGTHLLMTVFPKTGLVKSVDPFFEDLDNNNFADFDSSYKNARTIANANY